jgi:hypothetical protein
MVRFVCVGCFVLLMTLFDTALASDTPPVPVWAPASYPDEAGFRARIAGMVERIAAKGYGRRSLARSTCPDTGRPVFTWALEGETILSPFTGRRYVQGPTGYFGPKARDAEGRIIAFGGDPLKYDLPPATAALLLGQNPDDVRAFLGIPGNLRQQYHFAASNWARFFGLAGDLMDAGWHAALRGAVAGYTEARRPSDGVREHAPLERPLELVGRIDEHLGGGGTENHRTMWRTTAWLYAQWFGPDAVLSGRSGREAAEVAHTVLARYVRGLFTTGSGEYDSSIYYPHSIAAFLNLYDFSSDPAARALAQAALDYYVATYALKLHNGFLTGPQRRGFSGGVEPGEMDRHLWAWAAIGAEQEPDGHWRDASYSTAPVPPHFETSLHQATSGYRPNRMLVNLLRGGGPRPFVARMARPSYDMQAPNRHQEYFYASPSFALGSVQLDGVNNSGQQTVWSLNARGPNGSLVFGGGQPRWRRPEGHSPYDQWVQSRGALLFVTGPTAPRPDGAPTPTLRRTSELEGPRGYDRFGARAGPLEQRPPPAPDEAGLRTWFEEAPSLAATWVYVPRGVESIQETDTGVYLAAGGAFVAVQPLRGGWYWIDPPAGEGAGAGGVGPLDASWWERLPGNDPLRVLRHWRVLVVPGEWSGFALEAVEASDHPGGLAAFAAAHAAGARLEADGLARTGEARYRALGGDDLRLRYRGDALRPHAWVDGVEIDWSAWADGAAYVSPYVRIGGGRMWVSDGREAYEVDFTGAAPVWRAATP